MDMLNYMFFFLSSFLILSDLSLVPAEVQKVGQPLLCHGCVAVIKELHKGLRESSGRKKIISQRLKNLCQTQNFVSYAFSPPKMIKACNYIVETHKEDLVNSLSEYYKKFKTDDNLKLQASFCDKVINACEGTRRPTTEDDMTPRGLSLQDANEQLKTMASDEASANTPLEIEETATLEKPPGPVTDSSRDEL